MPLIPIKTVQKIGLFASKAGTPCSWNIMLFLDHFSYYHIQQNVYSINVCQTMWKTITNQHEYTHTQHTHTPLTVPNHASSDIVHRIFSYNMLQYFHTHWHTHGRTTLYTNTASAPYKRIRCNGNTWYQQKQQQITMFFLRFVWMYVWLMLDPQDIVRK